MDGPTDIPRLIGDLIREGVFVSRTRALYRVKPDIDRKDTQMMLDRAGRSLPV